MKKIVLLRNLPPKYTDQIRKMAPGWEIISGMDKEEWEDHIEDAEILLGMHRHGSEYSRAAGARWIHHWGAGVTSLPLDELKSMGIMLTNSSGVHPYPISESVFAMMLAFTRRLHTYVRKQEEKEWFVSKNLHEMHGKTLGILGVGNIGKEIARLGKAFQMKVIGMRYSGEPAEYVDQMVDRTGLSEILTKSDYVVNVLPWTKETDHFLGRTQFASMQSSAYFFNVGRGKTVDEEALVGALKNGQIAGAGLDVFEKEPLERTSPLWEMENVIITPHTSGLTGHYEERVMEIFLHNLSDYINGNEPSLNLVDLDKQY